MVYIIVKTMKNTNNIKVLIKNPWKYNKPFIYRIVQIRNGKKVVRIRSAYYEIDKKEIQPISNLEY